MKMNLIRKVVQNKDLLVRNPLGSKIFSHCLIHRDDPIGKSKTDLFLETQRAKRWPYAACDWYLCKVPALGHGRPTLIGCRLAKE